MLVLAFGVPAAVAAPPWSAVGGSLNVVSTNSASITATAVVGTTPHVASVEGGDVYVKRWTGAAWVQDGAARLNATAGAAVWVDAATDGTDVFVTWSELVSPGIENVFVKRWDGASWTALGGSLNVNAGYTAERPAIAIAGGLPTAAWMEGTAGTNAIFVKQWNGAAWVSLGGAAEPNPANWINHPDVTGDAGNVYLALSEWDGTNNDIFVRRWNGAAWVTLGASLNVSASENGWNVRSVMNGANLVVSWAENVSGGCGCGIHVRQWNGVAWSSIGTGAANAGWDAASHRHDMAIGASGPWIVYKAPASPLMTRALEWDGAQWRERGGAISRRHLPTTFPSIGMVSGDPWVAVGEEDESAVAQVGVHRYAFANTMVGNISDFVATPASGQVAFTWTNPPDGDYTGVDIYRSTVQGQLGTLRTSVAPPGTSWTDNTVVNGTTYYFTFVTHNAAGDRRETVYETADSSVLPLRYVSSIDSDGTDVYQFGGYDDASGLLDSIVRYDRSTTANSTLAATLSTARSNVGTAWVGDTVDRIVLMGGDVGGPSNAIQRFDPATGNITTAGVTMPAARAAGAVAYAPNTGRVYYLGGASSRWTGGTIYDTIQWYDPVADTVGTLGITLPQPMFRMNAVYWPQDGCIYMFGGLTTGDVNSDKIVRFCPQHGTIANSPTSLPVAMAEIAISRGSRGIVLLGASAAAYQQLIYEFDPFERAFLQHPVPMRLPHTQVTNAIPTAIDDVVYTAGSFPRNTKYTQVNLGVVVDATPSSPPNTPTNVSPASDAVLGVTSTTLTANAFSDPDGGASHQASHWQLRTASGSYSTPVADSGLDFTNLTSFGVSGLAENGHYCFRVRYRDQFRVFSQWSTETCFYVSLVQEDPSPNPASLEQFRADGSTTIAAGAWTTDGISTNVVLSFEVTDPDPAQTLTPWVEVRPNATPFSAACGAVVAGATFSGTPVAANTPGAAVTATVNVTGLTSGVQYHWRACTRDATARVSGWTALSITPTIDFGVIIDTLPTATPQSPAASSTWADTTPLLVARFNDPDPAESGFIDFEVCTVNPLPAQTCVGAGGTLSATGTSAPGIVDGANGSASVAPALALGTYHWRARARDQWNIAGAWSVGRQLIIGTPSMTVGVDDATLDLGSSLPGTDSSATTLVTITTDNATGYTLTATDLHDTNAAQCTTGACTGLWVPDWTGTDATPTAWAAGETGPSGRMGVSVLSVTGGTTTKLAKWGTGSTPTDYVNNHYAGLRTTATTLHARTSHHAGADTVLVAIRVNASTSTVAGTYDADITYTATANP